MAEARILVLCQDSSRFARIRGACGALGRGILRGVTDLGDAIQIVEQGGIRLVIVDHDDVNLLGYCSILAAATLDRNSCRVLTVVDDYDVPQATTLFQMGIADYMVYDDHRETIASAVAELAGMPIPSPMELELALRAYPTSRSRRTTAV